MNDNGQEQQPNLEGGGEGRTGIKPFEVGIRKEDVGDAHKIESPNIVTPMGMLGVHLVRRDKGYAIGPKPAEALGIDGRGILIEGTDHDFYNSGYYSLSLYVENPSAGPQSNVKFNLWTDNDSEHVLFQESGEFMKSTEEDDEPSEITEDTSGPYLQEVLSWGPKNRGLWVDPAEKVLRQINISLESSYNGV